MIRHWPAALVLGAGALLRVAVSAGYRPLFWFTDTGRYLEYAALGKPDWQRPWGYSGFLRLVLGPLSQREVVALQHALMLGCAGLLYAFLVRRGARPVVAALAVAPLSLSPLVVNVEHHLLSDWQFVVLLTLAAVLVCWPDARPAVWACGLAGLALAGAVVTRQVGLVLAPVLIVYLLVRRAGWLRTGAFAVAVMVPVAGYLAWVHATYGVYDFTSFSGQMLYARVAPIARCRELGHLTGQERLLCDPRPLARRPSQSEYLWGGWGAHQYLPDRVEGAFARKVIVHEPVAYARTVATEVAEVFYPGRVQHRDAACVAYWDYPDPLPGGCRTDAVGTKLWRRHPFSVVRPLADGLHAYQSLDAVAGPLLLACLLLVAVAVFRRGGRRLRLDALLFAALGVGLIVATMATADFTYRYTLPLYATLPVAAALAATRLSRGVAER